MIFVIYAAEDAENLPWQPEMIRLGSFDSPWAALHAAVDIDTVLSLNGDESWLLYIAEEDDEGATNEISDLAFETVLLNLDWDFNASRKLEEVYSNGAFYPVRSFDRICYNPHIFGVNDVDLIKTRR